MDLVIVASHPIQYQACVWRELEALRALRFEVWYGTDYGVRPQASQWGPKDFRWDVDLLSGYPHRFLPNWSRRPDPQRYLGKIYPPLVTELMALRPKAVLVQGYRNLHEQLGLLGGKLAGARLIFRADTNAWSGRQHTAQRLKHVVLRQLYESIDAFLSIGPANERHYLELGVPPKKLFTAPYGVDDAFFERMGSELLGEQSRIRAEFGVPERSPLVLFAGVLTPVKAVENLIDAVSSMPDVHLLVAGSGRDETSLRTLAERVAPGRVHFAGFLNQTRLARAYASADVFCLPSRYEPWGLVVNEALAMKRPVVVTKVCGVAPDVEACGAGIVVPAESSAALAEGLAQVLHDRDRFADGIERFSATHRTRLTAEALVRATLAES